MDPEDALAFTRARKTLPGGDIDRTTNQGRFLLALLRELHRDVGKNPGAVFRWLAIGRKWTRLDLPPEELYRLAVLATQIDIKDVKAQTVPVSIGAVGAASVVFISGGAEPLYRRFERTGTF
jgi:anionic cell wall polymer biosynthesis LytR-Cps2A-Psr (LCP) family protein